MYKNYLKRFLDICISLFFIILFFPFILIITFILCVLYKGKPFYIQRRPGKNEKIFTLIKFKTMLDRKDSSGNLLPDKERITKIGAFLRKTSLDEIPQLFNVILGNMSIIGPRPLLLKYLPYYTEFERQRHRVKPGITGLAQINGRNDLIWEDRMKLDVQYANNTSFILDLKILIKTVILVLKGKNIAIIPSESGRIPIHIRRKHEVNKTVSENKNLNR